MQSPQEKYDRIGADYNATRRPDPHLLDRLYQLLSPNPEGVYLDIGCGTGNYTACLADRGVRLIGVDPSEKMLEKARARSGAVDWRKGHAEQLPLEDASVDGAVGSLTLHHWTDLKAGFRELFRVLRPGSRLVIFTAAPAQMRGYWLNHYFPQMLLASIEQMPALDAVREAFLEAGFVGLGELRYDIRDDLQDLFLYAGKNRPELYLDPKVRRGISSFSDLSLQEEVEAGLARLEEDLENGQWEKVAAGYAHSNGDYLWVHAQRSE